MAYEQYDEEWEPSPEDLAAAFDDRAPTARPVQTPAKPAQAPPPGVDRSNLEHHWSEVLPPFVDHIVWVGRHGEQHGLTIRADTYEELQYYTQIVQSKIGQTTRADAPAQSNGHSRPAQPQAPAGPPPGRPPESWCGKHNVDMGQPKSKNGESWYSHKDPETGGWCRGK